MGFLFLLIALFCFVFALFGVKLGGVTPEKLHYLGLACMVVAMLIGGGIAEVRALFARKGEGG